MMTRTLRSLARLVGVGVFVAPGVCFAQNGAAAMIARVEGVQSPTVTAMDSLTLDALLKRLHVPGVSVAVIRDFQIHWTKSYGIADVQTGRPVVSNTAFQAASISKPLTAMAALRLVQEKRFSLDSDINAVLESWHIPVTDLNRTHPVTARSLFSHTSGADDGFGFPGYDPGAPVPTIPQLLNGQAPSNVKQVLFARPPFQQFKYSGGGLTIMQLALTELTKRPFAEFMKTTVLDPLGMTQSSYDQPPSPELVARAARAHDMQGARFAAPFHIYPELAAAGLWTTPSDLAQFVIEVQKASLGAEGKVLSSAFAREMITPVGVGPYGVGLGVESRGEGWYFGHSGGNWGFRADMVGHLRKGYGIVVMTNSEGGGLLIREIENRVAAAYHWDSLDKPLRR